jgi:hypothetical protein
MIKTGEEICQSVSDWLTLQEASELTGKSVNALTLLISRRKIDRIKKQSGRGKGKWLIHRDSVELLPDPDRLKDRDRLNPGQNERLNDRPEAGIPIHYFDSKLKEWTEERDRLQAGLLMYRYKFEEVEKQLRLLPAPPEMVASRLQVAELMAQQKEQALMEAREAIENLETELRQKEALMVKLQQRALPWWKKLFGAK